jgi:hypothetical protein
MSEARERGVQALQAGDLEKAIADLRAARDEDPSDYNTLTYLGAALDRAGHTEEAVEELQRAAALQPRTASAHYNLGVALEKTGRSQEAIAAYSKSIAVDPRHARAREALTRLGVSPTLPAGGAGTPGTPRDRPSGPLSLPRAPATGSAGEAPAAPAPEGIPAAPVQLPDQGGPATSITPAPPLAPEPPGPSPIAAEAAAPRAAPAADAGPLAATESPTEADEAPTGMRGSSMEWKVNEIGHGAEAAAWPEQPASDKETTAADAEPEGAAPGGPGRARRAIRGLGWGALYGQWWTLWIVFWDYIVGGGFSRPGVSPALAIIGLVCLYGLAGSIAGLIIGGTNVEFGPAIGIGVGVGALLGLAEVISKGQLMAVVNLVFWVITGRFIGAGIWGRVQQHLDG